jgi:NTP pyrophosphatase (non-canonical NTP hydrolase)
METGLDSKNDTELSIPEAQRLVDEFLMAKGEDWTRLSNHHLRVTHLVEEVGELARAVINLDAQYGDPNRRDQNVSREKKLANLQDSLGDVLYHLFAISIAYGIDLEKAFRESMNAIVARYPPGKHPRA